MSALALAVYAAAFGQAPSVSPAAPLQIGTPNLDFLTVKASSPGMPLRFANVIPGSERIEVNGKLLKASQDYALDYAEGVLYLRVPVRIGEMVTASYRYSESPDPNAAKSAKGLAGFKFDLVPGGLSFMTGLGLAERAADGSVLTSNTFGLNNSFKLNGNSSLSGVFLLGERTNSGTRAGMSMRGTSGGTAENVDGKSQLVLQSLKSKALGGDVTVDYQDVSKNFASFSQLSGSGLDDAAVNRLRAERGMTRLGWAANNLNVGGLGLSSSYRKVSDEAGTIDWRSYGLKAGGFKLDYSSQAVDNTFARFKDIAEGNREQLGKERGLKRENWAGEFASKVGKLSFSSQRIEDVVGDRAIDRSELAFESKLGSLNYGRQNIGSGFGKMNNLLGDEKGRYGLEAGLSRQWMSLNSGLFGSGMNLTFSDQSLQSNSGDFRAVSAALKSKTWSLEHTIRNTSTGFTSFNGMNDGEKDANINAIARMYGSNVKGRPEDRHFLGQSAGIDRSFTAIAAQPFKGWDLDFSDLKLDGAKDGGSVRSFGLKSKGIEATYRKQSLGEQFNEFNSLMSFEKMSLGNVAGLDRTDLGLKLSFGGNKRIAFSQSSADVAGKGFNRNSLEFSDTKIDVKLNSREVDSGLNGFNTLADGEKDLMLGLQGYKQRDASIRWQILPTLKADIFDYDSRSEFLNVGERMRNYNFSWSPLAKTNVNFVHNERSRSSDSAVLFAEAVRQLSISRDFGRLGQIAFLDESRQYEGSQSQALDSHKQFFAWETKLNAKTDLRTAQTNTNFQDGTVEKISENSVSTAVNNRLSVSVTDINVDRDGDERDEARRNYGFKFDLGKGMQVSYGYARQLIGETSGQMTSTVAIGNSSGNLRPDQVGQVQGSEFQGVRIGGGYGVNQWDGTNRTQAFSMLQFSTVKPVTMGPFKNVSLNLGMDHASDNRNFLRENRLAAFSGKIGDNTLGYRYVSQMHQSGSRGIDRIFELKTDTSEKRWWTAAVFYKVRTLPWNDQIMVRNFNFSLRPMRGIELVHKLEMNPEVARGDVFLGSVPQAASSNRWELNWKQSKSSTFGANWQELLNDQSKARARTGGVSLSFFEDTGSPLKLFYGLEQADGNVLRNTRHRYSIQYDQKAGPNQSLSFFLGNLSYQHRIENGFDRNNWTMRVNYQLKF
jgi:hypothetical protein